MRTGNEILRSAVVRLGLWWIRSARSLGAFSRRLAQVRQWKVFDSRVSRSIFDGDRAAYDCVIGGDRPEVIVSLTSYPARIGIVHRTIKSLLGQSFKPDRIILWLATSQFPQQEKELPTALTALCRRGLEIRWCDDIKSYKKLLPTLRDHASSIVITTDDDVTYEKDMIAELVQEYQRNPQVVVSHAVAKMERKPDGGFVRTSGRYHSGESYFNQPIGMGGVLYPPGCFDAGITDSALAMELAPTNDDQWFWLHVICNGRKIKALPRHKSSRFFLIDGSQENALWRVNDVGENNLYWRDFDRLRAHYPEFKRLMDECPPAEPS